MPIVVELSSGACCQDLRDLQRICRDAPGCRFEPFGDATQLITFQLTDCSEPNGWR
ncbi:MULTISPECIES: hypothetical protein [unclassified Pseudomonas]|uniref:hypothetical protein n=1 Tax=unclassified Pseudomonas TaxID=196821 RepID=UPI0030D97E6C